MKSTRRQILAGAATIAIICPAASLTAQPLYRSSQTGMPPYRYDSVSLNDKLYLGIDAGVAWQEDITIHDTVGDHETITFDPGARLDFQVGFKIDQYIATELEIGGIVSPVRSSLVLGTGDWNVDLDEIPILFNVIYNQPLGSHFSAYAGGGVGAVFSQYSNEFGDSTHTDTEFGFQGMAGVKYKVSGNWDIGIGYKFLGTTQHDVGPGVAFDGMTRTTYTSDGTLTHAILAAVTCRF